MKNILTALLLIIGVNPIIAQNKGQIKRKGTDNWMIKNKQFIFHSREETCEIKIDYPVIINLTNINFQIQINKIFEIFFGVNNYKIAKNRLEVCPGEFYNRYQIYKSKSVINIANTLFSFPTGAPHSNRFTNSLLVNPIDGTIIPNEAVFIHENIDSLKHIIVNEIKSIYRKNKIESFDQDYYYKELDTFQFFVSKDNFTFYLDDYNEDFMGELEVPISKGRIAFCLKTIN